MLRALPAPPDALARLAAQLTRGGASRGVSWLDGDGRGALGARSFLAWDPVETRAVAFGDPEPFALVRGLDRGPPGVGPRDAPRWIGALGYDLAWSAPRALGLRRGPRFSRAVGEPVAWLHRYRAVLMVDHARGTLEAAGDDARSADDALAWAREALDATPPTLRGRVRDVEGPPREAHRAAITGALEAIGRGDLYQVNLARRWTARLEGAPLALFDAMRRASPVPLGAYLEGPAGDALLARTMERFLAFDAADLTLESRPIKGTIARGAPESDDAAHAALRADGKEQAEHAMIVDLVRNDLGRVAATGSVEVARAFEVEPYARLSHLVSTVRAQLDEGETLASLLEASFPPGSVTGAPKLAAMEHIEALEAAPRGFYTGAIGHVGRDGSLSLAVTIRTAHVRAGGALTYFAGGGIVEASDPERETDETELKARAFLDGAAALSGL